MLEMIRVVVVLGTMAGGMLTSGVQQLATPNSNHCIEIGENRWDCGPQECFYYQGAWVCIDD